MGQAGAAKLRRLKETGTAVVAGYAFALTQTAFFAIRFNGEIVLLAGTSTMTRPCLYLYACVVAGALTGCGSALQMMGLQEKQEVPDAQKPERRIAIRLQAARDLNTDAAGRPLALVARIYKLRQKAAFEQAPYDSFLSAQKEKEALGADLLEVKEVMLIPGQRYEAVEKVSREAYYVGVVALFRNPAPQHWRLAFEAGAAEKSSIDVRAGACAILPAADAGSAPRCR